MSRYVDLYLLPIPRRNVSRYRRMSRVAGRVFRKLGALAYREYIASDLKVPRVLLPFPRAMKARAGEVLIYGAVEFKSESHRNRINKLIHKDPEMARMMTEKPPFDMKRMAYGGFKILVDA